MAILRTTATEQQIFDCFGSNAQTVRQETEFQDMERTHIFDDETYHVFALFVGRWRGAIEDAITKCKKKFEWL